MSDVKVAYNGQGKYRDNWDDTFGRVAEGSKAPDCRSGIPRGGSNPSPPSNDDMTTAAADGYERIYMVGNPFGNSWFGWVL